MGTQRGREIAQRKSKDEIALRRERQRASVCAWEGAPVYGPPLETTRATHFDGSGAPLELIFSCSCRPCVVEASRRRRNLHALGRICPYDRQQHDRVKLPRNSSCIVSEFHEKK